MPSTTAKQARFMAEQADDALPGEKRRLKIESAKQMHEEDRAKGRFYNREGHPTPEMREFLNTQ